jgi:hypothetical protein
MKNDSN